MNGKAKFLFSLGIAVLVIFVVFAVIGNVFNWFGWNSWTVQKVIQTEVGPQAAMDKYHWFVDQSNLIKQADANITTMRQSLADTEKHYTDTYGSDKTKWSQAAQVMYNQAWGTAHGDLVSVINMRNQTVRDYNAASAKWDWRIFKVNTQDFPDLPPQTYAELALP
jgi:predicted metalloprotease